MSKAVKTHFRNSSYPWIGGALIIILLGTVSVFIQGKPRIAGLGTSLVIMFGIYLTYRAYIRAVVIAKEDVLIIRNPFKDYEIPWEQVNEIEPNARIIVRTNRGEEIKVWCVQRANLSMMRGSRSFLDDVADDLNGIRRARIA